MYYVGSFDDEVLRHNSDAFNLDSINETLSQAALFGGPLLINDGSLMLSGAGRAALLSRDNSPLIPLIEAGYVKLFSRNGGLLSELPEQMQDKVENYRHLLADRQWSSLQRELLKLQSRVGPTVLSEPWPTKNLVTGFRTLVDEAMTRLIEAHSNDVASDAVLERLRSNFVARLRADPRLPGRTVWRQVCESPEFNLGPTARNHLHWLGLEAYHYNLAMASSLNAPDRSLGVITRYSRLFNQLRDPAVHQRHHDSKGRAVGAKLHELPVPELPTLIDRRRLHNSGLLREVVDGRSTLYQLKMDFLAETDFALQDRENLPSARKAADKYGNEIARYLGEQSKPKRTKLLDPVKVLAGAAATVILANHLGSSFRDAVVHDAIKEAMIGGAAWVALRFKTSAQRFTTPMAVDILDPLEDYADQVDRLPASAQGSQWFAFLGIDRNAVSQHVAKLPPF